MQKCCNGEPTISNRCPNRLVCVKFLDHEIIKSTNTSTNNRAIVYVSAYRCQQNDYDQYEQVESGIADKVILLSNLMVIRPVGRHKTLNFQIFKVIYPCNMKALLYDGNKFYSTENTVTLEPHEEMVGVAILNNEKDTTDV